MKIGKQTDTFWLEDAVPHRGDERRRDEGARRAAHADGGVLAVNVKEDDVVACLLRGVCKIVYDRWIDSTTE